MVKKINIDNVISEKVLKNTRIVFAVIILYYVVMRIIFPCNDKVHPLLYFTIQSNIFCAVFWLLSSFIKKDRVRSILSLAVTTYMIITGVVFIVFLDIGFTNKIYERLESNIIDEYVHYYSMICSIITHYLMPTLAFIDFILFTDKSMIKKEHLFLVLIYPLSYSIFHILYSILTGIFIYPFMDPGYLGHWVLTVLVVIVIAAIIIVSSRILIRINRRIRKRINNYYTTEKELLWKRKI